MSPLILDDTFEPYYAGRPGYTAPDIAKRRHARKIEAEPRGGDGRQVPGDGSEGPPKPMRNGARTSSPTNGGGTPPRRG